MSQFFLLFKCRVCFPVGFHLLHHYSIMQYVDIDQICLDFFSSLVVIVFNVNSSFLHLIIYLHIIIYIDQIFFFSGHKSWVLSIAWSPDGAYIVSGSKAGELQCWDPQTGKALGNPLTVNSQSFFFLRRFIISSWK